MKIKDAPEGFLKEYFTVPSKDEVVADYIRELHDLLWRFTKLEFPWASGDLKDFVENALQSAEHRGSLKKPSETSGG